MTTTKTLPPLLVMLFALGSTPTLADGGNESSKVTIDTHLAGEGGVVYVRRPNPSADSVGASGSAGFSAQATVRKDSRDRDGKGRFNEMTLSGAFAAGASPSSNGVTLANFDLGISDLIGMYSGKGTGETDERALELAGQALRNQPLGLESSAQAIVNYVVRSRNTKLAGGRIELTEGGKVGTRLGVLEMTGAAASSPVVLAAGGGFISICENLAGESRLCGRGSLDVGLGTQYTASAAVSADWSEHIADDDEKSRTYFYAGPELRFDAITDNVSQVSGVAGIATFNLGLRTQ